MTDPEKNTGHERKDNSEGSTFMKRELKSIQVLLVEELEVIEKKLRKNLEANDKNGI